MPSLTRESPWVVQKSRLAQNPAMLRGELALFGQYKRKRANFQKIFPLIALTRRELWRKNRVTEKAKTRAQAGMASVS